jgi:hypothetical protein
VAGLDDAEAAALDRMLAEQAAGPGREILAARPADVAAAVALTGVAVARSTGNDAPGTAGKTLDPIRLHVAGFGTRCQETDPSIEGRPQSVEYFGWTFSPRIAAMALLAAIAASPIPTVISVILPG